MKIHIVGPPELFNYAIIKNIKHSYPSPSVVAIDTDKISSENWLKILKKYNFTKATDENKAFNDVVKLNKKSLDTILKKNASKTIIFVGSTYKGLDKILTCCDYRYFIDANPNIVWREYNARMAHIVAKNSKTIINLYTKPSLSANKIVKILRYKYGISDGFACNFPSELNASAQETKSFYTSKGYTPISFEEILIDLFECFDSIKN